MSESPDIQRDGTVMFLPHRLNRQPVIVRGLTADELWILVGLSAAFGLGLGILLAWLSSSIAMVPTIIVLCIAIGVFTGGSFLRRQKRGRPDTWLYRQIQWRIRCRYPVLSQYVGGDGLIVRSGCWTVRRSAR